MLPEGAAVGVKVRLVIHPDIQTDRFGKRRKVGVIRCRKWPCWPSAFTGCLQTQVNPASATHMAEVNACSPVRTVMLQISFRAAIVYFVARAVELVTSGERIAA